jgi:hypothetical protein
MPMPMLLPPPQAVYVGWIEVAERRRRVVIDAAIDWLLTGKGNIFIQGCSEVEEVVQVA